MVHALTLALQEFEGAMLIVSHDRHLLANTVNEFYSIHQGRFTEFSGDLADYESWLRRGEGEESGDEAAASGGGDVKLDRKTQRQQAAARRLQQAPLRKEIAQLEKRMESLQRELAGIEKDLGDQTLYSEAQKPRLTALLQKQGALRSELETCEEDWLELQETLLEE